MRACPSEAEQLLCARQALGTVGIRRKTSQTGEASATKQMADASTCARMEAKRAFVSKELLGLAVWRRIGDFRPF